MPFLCSGGDGIKLAIRCDSDFAFTGANAGDEFAEDLSASGSTAVAKLGDEVRRHRAGIGSKGTEAEGVADQRMCGDGAAELAHDVERNSIRGQASP